MTRPRVASFFSGIGGFDLAFEKAGFEVTFQCEVDSYCNDILSHHWPKVKKSKDIKELTYEEIPTSDVWCAGFPCQDVSLARARPRAGLKGERSGLFYQFAELVSQGLPRIVVLENVPGLLNSHEGRDFAIIIRTLAELGYGVGWRVLNSKHFGVPQSRQRVFIVGCHRDWRRAGQILFEPERGAGHLEKGRKPGEKSLSPFRECATPTSPERTEAILNGHTPYVPKLAFCLAATSGRHTGTDWSRTYVSYKKDVRRLTPEECERLQGFPADWTQPTNLFDDPDEIDSLRYAALGNAVSVPVARWLAQRILASETVRLLQKSA